MILRINVDNFELNEDLDKYIRGKVDSLSRLVPRKDRPTTLVELELSEQPGKMLIKTCGLRVKLRRVELVARETTQHIYASLDVAAADIEQQLRTYNKQQRQGLRKYTRGTARPADD